MKEEEGTLIIFVVTQCVRVPELKLLLDDIVPPPRCRHYVNGLLAMPVQVVVLKLGICCIVLCCIAV